MTFENSSNTKLLVKKVTLRPITFENSFNVPLLLKMLLFE